MTLTIYKRQENTTISTTTDKNISDNTVTISLMINWLIMVVVMLTTFDNDCNDETINNTNDNDNIDIDNDDKDDTNNDDTNNDIDNDNYNNDNDDNIDNVHVTYSRGQ